MSTPKKGPHLVPVCDGVDNDCDGLPAQRPLRLLGVARPPSNGADTTTATTTATGLPAAWSPGDVEIVPLEGGQALLPVRVSEERRRELLELHVRLTCPPDRREVSTCDTPDKVRVAAGNLLRTFAGRPGGPPALHLAGKLLVEHGPDARRVLAATWRPDWPAPLAKLDAHLARAGVPAADTLPGIG